MTSSKTHIYLNLLSVAFFWGTSWAISKIGLRDLSPVHLAVLRFMVASGIFLFMVKTFHKDYIIEKEDRKWLWILGFLGVTLYFFIQYFGLNMTTTVNASILIATSPIFTVLLASMIFNQEKISPLDILGTIIAFLGIFFVFTAGRGMSISRSTILGDLLLLSNSLIWALFTVLGKNLVDKYDPFVVMAYINIYAAITVLPIVFTPSFISSVKSASYTTWAAIIYLAVFCSVYSYYMWYKGIKIIGASKTAVFNYINPMIAVIIGILLLKEEWNIYTLIGGILVFIGVYMVTSSKS